MDKNNKKNIFIHFFHYFYPLTLDYGTVCHTTLQSDVIKIPSAIGITIVNIEYHVVII